MHDVLVVGGGAAGRAAARAAAEAGVSVGLVDASPWTGGQVWREEPLPDGVRHYAETTVFSGKPGRLSVEGPAGPLELSHAALVLATGARELFLPFCGWTLPGVTGVVGLQSLVKSGWDIRGKRVLIAGSGPLLLAVAATLRERGGQVVALVEQAPYGRVACLGLRRLRQAIPLLARLRGVPRRYADWPVAAHLVEGGGLRVQLRDESLTCDLLACGFGLVPEMRLARLLGCAATREGVTVAAHQRTSLSQIFCAGEASGVGGRQLARLEGRVAGLAAAGRIPGARLIRQRDRERTLAGRLAAAFALDPALREVPGDDTIVCRCEDVSLEMVKNKRSFREAKLLERCGMGPCQGRICAPALEYLLGWPLEQPRPPLFPVSISTLSEVI